MPCTLASFNVNSIRVRLHQLEALIAAHAPEIIGLQETKVTDADFPREEVAALGYHAVFCGQKTHYGVALLSREEPRQIEYGLPGDGAEAQKRFIAASYRLADGRELRVLNGYFPQGESREHPVKFPAKERFYRELGDYLRRHCDPQAPLALMGDYNVAPAAPDVGIGEANARRWLRSGKTSFLPEERAWFGELFAWGLHDSFRLLHPDAADRFSWFDYRSRGFEAEPRRGLRIDHILLSDPLRECCSAAGIDYAIRAMDKPSDHCPVWATLA